MGVKRTTPESRRMRIEAMANHLWDTIAEARSQHEWQEERLAWILVTSAWVPVLHVIHNRQTGNRKPKDPRSTRIIISIKSTKTLADELIRKMEKADEFIVMDLPSKERCDFVLSVMEEMLTATESNTQRKKRERATQEPVNRIKRWSTAAAGLLSLGATNG